MVVWGIGLVEAVVYLYSSLDPRPRSWRNGLGPASITPMAAPPVGSTPTGGLFLGGAKNRKQDGRT